MRCPLGRWVGVLFRVGYLHRFHAAVDIVCKYIKTQLLCLFGMVFVVVMTYSSEYIIVLSGACFVAGAGFV